MPNMKDYIGKVFRVIKTKKVILFNENGSYSYDSRVIREADALADAGWDINVISPKRPDDPLFKKIRKNLRVYFYPMPTPESSTYIGQFIEHITSLILGSLLTLWILFRHGFSIFHACNPMDILWIIILPYKLIGKKFIFDQHDLTPELHVSLGSGSNKDLIYKILVLLENYSYKFADAVIATNNSYKNIAITKGGKKSEQVFVVRNGPDLNKFKIGPGKEGLISERDILVGYLGNMNPQDGVEYLLNAANDIITKRLRKDIKFVFIGGGTSQPLLVKRSKKMGLKESVTFTGRIPDDEMLEVLNTCDICVQPDPLNPLNDKSTMNKIMEYMALKKPVIAFDLKETRVSGGDIAIYVKPNDYIELADKIEYLADNKDLRIKLGKLGKERVEKKLAWNYSIPNLIAAYEYVLKKT